MKKRILSNALTLLFLVLFIWYGFSNKDDLSSLGHIGLWALVLVAFGKMMVFVSNGLFTTWTAEVFTKKFNLVDGVYITILSAIGNFFGPLLGGASIRAVYLKKYYNLQYSKFTATLMGYYLLLFMTNALLAIVSLIALPHTRQTKFLLLFFGIWFVVLLGLMFVRLPAKEWFAIMQKRKVSRYVLKVIYDIEDGWAILVRNKNLLVKLLGLGFLSLGATYFISWIEFSALHIHINAAALGLYTSLVATSLLISLTPGAIGIREAMLLLVSTTLGVSNQDILKVAVIDRGVHFLLLGVLFLATRHSKLRQSLVDA